MKHRWLIIAIGLVLTGGGCGEPVDSATATERTRHVLLLSNTERADTLAARIREQLTTAPYPARLSDISRKGESLATIAARLPWALQQGVDVFVLDLRAESAAADSLRTAIAAQARRANPDLRILRPDSSDQLELFPAAGSLQ